MKTKRILKPLAAALLAAAVVVSLCALPPKAKAVYFTAVNEILYELKDETMPTVVGGEIYVPYTVFVNTTLNLGFIYDRSTSRFMLYDSSGARLVFDGGEGLAYDQYGTAYEQQTATRNSLIYLPAQFVCSIFGLNYAYLSAEPAPIIRITNSSSTIDNSIFADAAYHIMSTFYERYEASKPEPSPSLPVSPTPSRPPVSSGEVAVYMSFTALSEETAVILDELEEYGCRASFFLTAEDIEEYPDTVRRIAGSGHTVGIKCTDPNEYAQASALLFTCAKVKTIIAAAPESARTALELSGLIVWGCPGEEDGEEEGELTAAALGERVNEEEKRLDLRFECTEETAAALRPALSFFRQRGYNVKRITETDTPYTYSEA